MKIAFRIVCIVSQSAMWCEMLFGYLNKTAAVDMLLLKSRVTWSASRIYWSVVLWRARKPNWHGFSKLFPSMCLWIILRMTFSNSSPVVSRRLIGLRFWGNFDPCQDDGKRDNRKQWLNRWVRRNIGFRGRCLRQSFGMESIPQASFVLSLLFFVHHKALLSPEDCCPLSQTRPGCEPLPAVRGFPHTDRVVRIGLPDSQQSLWLF